MAEQFEDFARPSRSVPVGTPELQEFVEARKKEQQEQALPDVSFTDFIGAAKQEDWMSSYAFRNNEKFAPDLNYMREGLDQELFGRLTKDIPEEYHDFLEETVSEAHALPSVKKCCNL